MWRSMKYEHMSWAAHLYPLTSIASPLHSTSHPLPSTAHQPHQALETIFVEEAFGDFNEKSFMDAARRAQSGHGPSGGVGGWGHTSASAPPGASLLGRASWGGLRGALLGASHSGAIPAISPRSPRDLPAISAAFAHAGRQL